MERYNYILFDICLTLIRPNRHYIMCFYPGKLNNESEGTYENLSFHTVLATWSRVITPRIVSLIAPQVALKSTILGFKDIFQITPIFNVK